MGLLQRLRDWWGSPVPVATQSKDVAPKTNNTKVVATQPVKRGPGRPKGSTTKAKTVAKTAPKTVKAPVKKPVAKATAVKKAPAKKATTTKVTGKKGTKKA